MDVDVNRPMALTKIYEASGLRFRGVAPSQMMADKILLSPRIRYSAELRTLLICIIYLMFAILIVKIFYISLKATRERLVTSMDF